jgi:membrane-associated PAP2 superfamily phosphatase
MVPQPLWPKVAGLWYLCISLGFVLLGIRAMLVGAPLWTVILRWVIAAGFFALALLERQERKR